MKDIRYKIQLHNRTNLPSAHAVKISTRIKPISTHIVFRSSPDLHLSILGSLDTDPYLGVGARCWCLVSGSSSTIDSLHHFVPLISSHIYVQQLDFLIVNLDTTIFYEYFNGETGLSMRRWFIESLCKITPLFLLEPLNGGCCFGGTCNKILYILFITLIVLPRNNWRAYRYDIDAHKSVYFSNQ